jgi:hypothetical protein
MGQLVAMEAFRCLNIKTLDFMGLPALLNEDSLG